MEMKSEAGPGQAVLDRILKALKNVEAKVGWFETAKYPDTGIPVAEVAATNEFGDASKGIPSRSFMRTTMRERENEWRELAKQEAQQILTGKNVEDVVERIAIQATGDIGHKITTITSPKLSDRTVKAREEALAKKQKQPAAGLKKPLIFTAYMLTSLTYTIQVTK